MAKAKRNETKKLRFLWKLQIKIQSDCWAIFTDTLFKMWKNVRRSLWFDLMTFYSVDLLVEYLSNIIYIGLSSFMIAFTTILFNRELSHLFYTNNEHQLQINFSRFIFFFCFFFYRKHSINSVKYCLYTDNRIDSQKKRNKMRIESNWQSHFVSIDKKWKVKWKWKKKQ